MPPETIEVSDKSKLDNRPFEGEPPFVMPAISRKVIISSPFKEPFIIKLEILYFLSPISEDSVPGFVTSIVIS